MYIQVYMYTYIYTYIHTTCSLARVFGGDQDGNRSRGRNVSLTLATLQHCNTLYNRQMMLTHSLLGWYSTHTMPFTAT